MISEAKTQTKQHDHDFLLNEIGLKKYFDQLAIIAESRQNEYVKNKLTFIAAILKREIAEYHQREQIQYQRIESFKTEAKLKQDFIYYLCNYYGLNYQLEMTCFLTNEGAKKTLKQSEETFKTGLEWLKNNYPEHYKTLQL